ncbi:hypothetical protein [Nocardioides sp. Leaf285]|uniref:hypothetical protein n=1 Tax=Nocardioides sp. Leaf285 TaxID=1736322 RepID=UPI0007039BD1|nr:hypothetical protein [Nocardioides sp. Leaf285]KQP63088.1 hypothetical protein ASF47_18935 [Nocardioides sp. Leaf285]
MSILPAPRRNIAAPQDGVVRRTISSLTMSARSGYERSPLGRRTIDFTPTDGPFAAPLTVLGLVEAYHDDDDEAYALIADRITGRMAAMGATRVVVSLLAQCVEPDQVLTLTATGVRQHTCGALRDRIAIAFVGDMMAGHVSGGPFTVDLNVPVWRPDRHRAIVDALTTTVLAAMVAFVALDEGEIGTLGEASVDEAVDQVMARMRTTLYAEAAGASAA